MESDVTSVSGNSISLGSNYISGTHSENFSGNIAEIIVYSATKNQSLEREKIVSYLALKYGITLSGDYYNSAETVVWDVGNSDGFDNRIFGIARDDDSGLDQKIARSTSGSTIITVALGNDFSSSNISTTRTEQLDNQSFLLLGDDGGTTDMATAITNLNSFVSYNLTRIWKIAKTGISTTSENLYLQFDLNAIGEIYNRPELSASDFTLFLGETNDFSGTLNTFGGLSFTDERIVF